VDKPEQTSSVENGAIEALLGDREKYKRLVLSSLWDLGRGAIPQDAENALQEFCLERLLKVLREYRPGRQSLNSYIKQHLKWHCSRKGKRLRKSRVGEESLEAALENGHEFPDENPNSQPHEKFLHEEEMARLAEASRPSVGGCRWREAARFAAGSLMPSSIVNGLTRSPAS
jgi:hypothetical protein